MPPRTNPFQELVTLVQRALAPTGAKITPSAMVDVPGQDSQREIDVLIESSLGPYRITIAVEAKDERRKMDQSRLEQLLGKYTTEGSIKVNKLVIVTHQGFHEPAIERAKRYGDQVELLTYKQAESADWARLAPKSIRFTINPHLCSFRFVPPIPGIDPKRLWREALIFCSHGRGLGTPDSYVTLIQLPKLLEANPKLLEEAAQKALTAPKGQAMINVPWPLDHHCLYIDKVNYPITEIGYSIHITNSEAKMTSSVCEITDASGQVKQVPMAEAIVAGQKIQIVLPDGLQSKQIVLKLDAAPEEHTGPSGNAPTPEAAPEELDGPSCDEPTADSPPEQP